MWSGMFGGRLRIGKAPKPGPDLIGRLQAQFDGADDVKFRFLSLGREAVEAAVVYIDGLVDDALLEQTLLRPLLRWAAAASPGEVAALRRDLERLGRSVLTAGAVRRAQQELRVDYLRLREELRRALPAAAEELDWKQTFPAVRVDVDVRMAAGGVVFPGESLRTVPYD